MIPVYIRHEEHENGILLGTFHHRELDSLCSVFSAYETRIDDNEAELVYAGFTTHGNKTKIIFEIVVGES
jgi:hypothetical protein